MDNTLSSCKGKSIHGISDFCLMKPLNPNYITGLVEGEGCFSISFTFRKKLKLGIETRASFSISLNKRDLELLKNIHQYFKCGAIRFSKKDRTYKYEVRNINELIDNIIPHFIDYSLVGYKKKDFEAFQTICRHIAVSRHLNRKWLIAIVNEAYKMNPAGKRKRKKADLLKMLQDDGIV